MGKRMAERPPGPKGRWLAGNSYDYDQDRIGFLRYCQAEYGDVFSFSPSTVVVCDPELIHQVLIQSNEVFLADAPLFADPDESARLESSINGWMRTRERGRQGMTRKIVKAHGHRIIMELNETLRATAGREFDVVAVMRDYGSRMVAEFVFGPGARDVIDAVGLRSALAAKFMTTNLTIPKWLPLPSVRHVLRADEKAHAAIAAHVNRRRACPHTEPEDMVDILIHDTEDMLAEDDIIDVLKASMLASFGSPGASLAWAIREIARDGDVYQRLHDEAITALGDTGSLVNDDRLPYSKAFVKEILRLYPPTWLMGRIVRRTYTLGDWTLTAGQNIMFSPYLLHRDPRWWPRPDELLPERWLAASTPGSRRAYIPFGAGPRMCLGLHLGLYLLVIVASCLAADYRIESANITELQPPREDLLLPHGLRLRLTPASMAAMVGPQSWNTADETP